MNIETFRSTLNQWGNDQVPFLFVIDFEMEKPLAWKVEDIRAEDLLYDFNGITNAPSDYSPSILAVLEKSPMPYETYLAKFDKVIGHLAYGDSFLTNLTIATEIKIQTGLRDLFFLSHARYKLWMKDLFLVFSPETFIQVEDENIRAFPMKGTINAGEENAINRILNDRKEEAEHVTIVDLIRNDLSVVATDVHVKRFRYIDRITTNGKDLLQVSSEINGMLSASFKSNLGDLLLALLPAGSISGAPKKKTLDVIRQAEESPRGYYTGVCGYYDGKKLDSGVMIRFVEQSQDRYIYHSGGGITTQSEPHSEYQEALDKIYVPVN